MVAHSWSRKTHFFFYYIFMNIAHTNKYKKKLQSPGHKQKENVKKIIITSK